MNYIYALIDPHTNEARYVGKTVNPQQRYTAHCCTKSRTYVSKWVQSLRRTEDYPEMVILESGLSGTEWPESEQFWIAYLKSLGANLTNITDGGYHVVKEPADYDDGCYTMPDFDRIERSVLKLPSVRKLSPSLLSCFTDLIRRASKTDRGLVCYTRKDVSMFVRLGLLAAKKIDGVECYLVSKTDAMALKMRESTGILCS